MSQTDGILVLLQDIKQILFGGVLSLLGTLFTALGLVLGGWFALILFGSVPLLLSGVLFVWTGWKAHEVIDHQD